MILKKATGVFVAMTHDQFLIPGDFQRSLKQVVNLVGTLFGQVMPRRGYRLIDAAGVAMTDPPAGSGK